MGGAFFVRFMGNPGAVRRDPADLGIDPCRRAFAILLDASERALVRARPVQIFGRQPAPQNEPKNLVIYAGLQVYGVARDPCAAWVLRPKRSR